MTDPARPLARGLPLANRGGGEPPSYQSDGRPPPEILSHDELRLVVRAMRTDRDRAMTLIAYYGAMRASEVCDLRMESWDRGNGTLRVWMRKTRRWRVAPIHPGAMPALERYVRLSRPAMGGPLFLSRKGGGALTPNAFWRVFRRACIEAGVPLRKAHTHSLRSSRATHLLMDGATLGQVQDVLGHSSPRVTHRYLKAAPGWASSLLATGDAI